MAWNQPGGNKNDESEGNNGGNGDKKPNNPWGSGGNQPPDLEQLFSKFFNNIKKALGMNSSSNSGGGSMFPVVVVLLIIGAFAAWSSAHKIGPSERGVVLVFGKYAKTMTPGLNFTWPKPIAEVIKVDVMQLYSVGEEGEMLTEDKNLVFLEFDIQYRIREDKVTDYLFLLEDPDATVQHAAESSVRQVVGTNSMSHLLNENREVAINNIVKELQDMLDQYGSGIQVTNFNFKEVHPPTQVKDAFDDVVKAREDAKTFINEANEYARKEVPLAEGNALKIIQEAEAYKEAIIVKSEGEAQKFDLIREQYELAPEVTQERLYLDAMEKVFSSTSKILLDSDNNNSMMYLPLDQMMKKSRNNSDPIYLGTTTVTVPQEGTSGSSYNHNNGRNNTSRRGRGQ